MRSERLGLLLMAALFLAADGKNSSPAAEAAGLQDAARQAMPAVVRVETINDLDRTRSHGSGFIYDPKGYVLTSHHVIEGASEISVVLSDGRAMSARVIDFWRELNPGLTRLTDVAVLKIEASNLTALPLRPGTPVQRGQRLIALGYPDGPEAGRPSEFRGIVTEARPGWIETDAEIDRGTSGGPVLDSGGRVIGVATYERRFWGVMDIEAARALAERSVASNAERIRILKVPGIEYFLPLGPTGNKPKIEIEKIWRVTSSAGATGVVTETTLCTSENGGGRIYETNRTASGRQAGDPKLTYIDSRGAFDVSANAEGFWARVATEPSALAVFPLRLNQTWDFRQTWRAKNAPALRPGDPPPPNVIQIEGRTTILAMSELVTVPFGTIGCLKMREDRTHKTNLGDQGRLQTTTWYAAGVGAVKIVEEATNPNGTARLTRELESVNWIR